MTETHDHENPRECRECSAALGLVYIPKAKRARRTEGDPVTNARFTLDENEELLNLVVRARETARDVSRLERQNDITADDLIAANRADERAFLDICEWVNKRTGYFGVGVTR